MRSFGNTRQSAREVLIMRKGELRRQTILESAGRLFFENGYIQTTIEDILKSLGCSKGSFYHHFTSKLAVLEAFCHERVKNSFAQYLSQHVEGPFDALNALLYFSHPLRRGEEDIIKLILALRLREESSVVMSRIRLSLREAFYPELEQQLTRLNANGYVYFAQAKLPELLWASHTAFFETAISAIAAHVKNSPALAGQLRDIINADRYLWERLLDAPFGSIQIVTLDEILSVTSCVYAEPDLQQTDN